MESNMTRKYRVRQCAAAFLLERLESDGLGDSYWHILDSGYSWDWAERVAAEYHCQII